MQLNEIFLKILSWFHDFLKIVGPDLPKALYEHSTVTRGNELILLGGGSDKKYGESSSVYKMSCNNGQFSKWTDMDVQLKIARSEFVASFIPNSLIYSQSTP